MRILGYDCGCDARREIIFDHLGGREALFVAGTCIILIAAWRLK